MLPMENPGKCSLLRRNDLAHSGREPDRFVSKTNNTFLSIVGQNCPNLNELDIAGADIVTDFGVVCLLFVDPEQIFLECWNREKTVGSVRKSQRYL